MKNEKLKVINVKKCVLFSLFFFLCSFFSAFAQDRVIDNAGLLSAQQKTSLNQLIADIASNYKFDLVILTENSIGNTDSERFAANFYDSNGYGIGQNRDGSIFLRVVEDPEYSINTTGRGFDILNDTAFNKLENDIGPYLDSRNVYEAFQAFILDWQEFLELEANGRNYNIFHQWNIVMVVVSWLIALAIGFIVVMVWQKGMNTALTQAQATAYVIPNSLNYTEKKDTFLYSKTSKIRRQSSSSSSSGRTTISSGAVRSKSRGGRR